MGKGMFMRKGEVHTAPCSGILASDIAVGSTVKLLENGTAVEYLVVNQGIPSSSSLYDSSCDGTWLLRKGIYTTATMMDGIVTTNDYSNSDTHTYLNSTFLGLLDSNIQSAIKQVKIPYQNGGYGSVKSGANGLSTKIFLLSGYEVGWTTSNHNYLPVDGACLDYFIGTSATDTKRSASYNGYYSNWWLRSPNTNNTSSVWQVYTDGSYQSNSANTYDGIRPALIVPSNALFDQDTMILKGVA